MQDNKERLTSILNDPHSSAEEKAQAQRELAALGAQADFGEPPLHPDALAMLAALGIRQVSELTGQVYEAYCSAHHPRPSDPIVREVTRWWEPDYLHVMGMTRRKWWEQAAAFARRDNRPDAEVFARRKLAELDGQP